jgi:hypothetical protein
MFVFHFAVNSASQFFKSTSMKPGMVVIFFHGIGFGKHNEWKDPWTSQTASGQLVCWPQEWLPADLASENINTFGFFLYHMIQLFFLVPTPM